MNVGILGGGQLARMLALAGWPLDIRCRTIDPDPYACSGSVAPLTAIPFDDSTRILEWIKDMDVITYELEHIPQATIESLPASRLHPPAQALLATQDRLLEKKLCEKLSIPTAAFSPVAHVNELRNAIGRLGLPAVLKTRRYGYDGKGQWIITQATPLEPFFGRVGTMVPLIVEQHVDFEWEAALAAVRALDGTTRFYPLTRTHQEKGILRWARPLLPNEQSAGIEPQAREIMMALLEALNYVGVMVIEFFVTANGLLVNEMAPRVHNSAHWTIEGAECSQFENHLRAICGYPLGATESVGHCATVNLVGHVMSMNQLLSLPGLHLHLYGKMPRPGRKLGHVTLRHQDSGNLTRSLDQVLKYTKEPLIKS